VPIISPASARPPALSWTPLAWSRVDGAGSADRGPGAGRGGGVAVSRGVFDSPPARAAAVAPASWLVTNGADVDGVIADPSDLMGAWRRPGRRAWT
jgi:hypothetical protein